MPSDTQPDIPIVARTLIQCRAGEDVPRWVFVTNDINDLVALAGGERERGETPKEAALREAEEEAGIRIRPDEIFLEHVWEARVRSRENPELLVPVHKHLYIATIPISRALRQRFNPEKNPGRVRPHGNEGERAHIATLDDMRWILNMKRFVPGHLQYLTHSDRDLLGFLRRGTLIPPRPQ